MVELEKILYALICRATDAPSTCAECSYYVPKYSCCNLRQIMQDALDLLKEQVPRVMTIEEVTHSEDWLWYEIRNMYQGWVKMKDCDGEWITWEDYSIDRPCFYGVQWRCWTSRPSAELMASTPWGGDAE